MQSIQTREVARELRTRFNPHMPAEDAAYEHQRHLMTQHRLWFEAKEAYSLNREEIRKVLKHLSKKDQDFLTTMEKVIERECEDNILDAMTES